MSLFNLYKISAIKSHFNDALHGLYFGKLVSMFISSFYSYNVNKKNLLFVIKYLEGSKHTFYSIQFFSRFYRTFFY